MGKNKKVFIIAEVGVNHNGSMATAMKMVDAAKGAGADAVKFQVFDACEMACQCAPKAAYQKGATLRSETQFDMLKKLELGEDAWKKLIGYCRKKHIAFIASPFDMKSIGLLSRLKLNIFKIPSGEIINLPYLRKIGSVGERAILSTGMATMEEIAAALNVLAGSGMKKDNITVLHCTTEYPAPIEEINLRAMEAIRKVFGVRVGYSDHSIGIEIPVAAVALGATMIEKHFTLDRKMEGPDHKASLEPGELREMVKSIRNVEKALGSGVKRPSDSELRNMSVVRKSIVASRDIPKGESFTVKNITAKRGGAGVSPMLWDRALRSKAKRDFKKDELIRL